MKEARKTAFRGLANIDWLNPNVILTVLTIKILVLIFGFHAYQVLSDVSLSDFQSYLNLWTHWDAQNYLYIAEFGYASAGEKRFLLVFFPLFSFLTALFAIVFRNYVLSAFIVSTIASFALGVFFRLLVKLDYSEKTAQKAVFFLFIFPTSYFLHIPYTESLFLALAIGCFWAARTNKWLLAAILGGLACQTRINGILLVLALLFEIWEQYKQTKKLNWSWFWILVIPTGFLSYLFLNYSISGNPLMFLEYQRENWGRYLRLPLSGFIGKFDTAVYETPANSNIAGFQELFFTLIGAFAIIAGWRYLRNSYRVWMILNWLLFVSTSFILSVPRYTITLFPIFILAALIAEKDKRVNLLITVWSILYLGLFTALFVKGHWAF